MISPMRLTELQQAGSVGTAQVQHVDLEWIGVGSGFSGRIARLRLEWDQDAAAAPRSLIAKFPSDDPTVRQFMRPLFASEVEFYRQVAPVAGVAAPHCYYATPDSERTDGLLLLEDLARCTFRDDVGGCSSTEALIAVTELARLHATWWDHPQVGTWAWVSGHMHDPEAERAFFAQIWPQFLSQFGTQVPGPFLALGTYLHEHFAVIYRTVLSPVATPPYTLQHGDYRLDNLAFGRDQADAPVYVLDWQTPRRGRGTFDLARFLVTSLAVEDRRRWEGDLLRAYYEGLVEAGLQYYTPELVLHDYQVGVVQNLMQQVAAAVFLNMTSPAALSWHAQVGQRLAALIEDHHLIQLLTQQVRASEGQ